MTLGDGIRRNIAHVTQEERNLLRDAIIALNHKFYPGNRADALAGGVSKWFKQDEIHANTHVHDCPAFIPWHRDLVNRFETLIREVNPQLSLHYWDWTQDPRSAPDGIGGTVNLFTDTFMGSPSGEMGPPWSMNNFYTTSGNRTNPADPPGTITRNVGPGTVVPNDNDIINALDFQSFHNSMTNTHNLAHQYIGGTISNAHTSFRDPFVFLLHSNVDRLFALWQLNVPSVRLDAAQVYGVWSDTKGSGVVGSGQPQWGILSPLEPWAGDAAQNPATTGKIDGVAAVRPWAPPENEQNLLENQKDSKHPTVIQPPCYDTNPIVIEQVNPGGVISFNDVPSGETQVRAAHFRVVTCFRLKFRVTSGPTAPYTVFSPGGSVPVSPSGDIWTDGYLFFSFTGGTANTTAPTSSVTIHCDEANRDFTFTLIGNSITRPTVAVMMVLDQSGSMDDPAGNTGLKRIQVLRSAAGLFVDVIQDGNAVGIIRFDTVAYPANDPTFPGLPVTTIGSGGILDPGRTAARNAVLAHKTNPKGLTSIGAGIQLGRDMLKAVTGFQEKAMLVFTDGIQNEPPRIEDIHDIDDRTFAIGLGDGQQINTQALTAIANGTGGSLHLSGLLSDSTDDFFLLHKFFLQILAGVTNTNIVRDPSGFITHSNAQVVIPFVLNEADINATVILLTDIPALDFFIQTPGGDIIRPSNAASVGVNFSESGTTSYYRYTLPVAIGAGARTGTWKALLKLNEAKWKRHCSGHEQIPSVEAGSSGGENSGNPACRRGGVRYSLIAMAWSNIRMRANVSQSNFAPGATATLNVTLDEYGLPVDHRASVYVEVRSPNGSTQVITLPEAQPGVFQGSTILPITGVYRFHVTATGVTLRGSSFTREAILTGAAFPGGDQPLPCCSSGTPNNLSCLLQCLLKEQSVNEFLIRLKLDPVAIKRCVEQCSNAK